MNKKIKISISLLGIVIVLAIILVAFRVNDKKIETATVIAPAPEKIQTNEPLTTTSPLTGDKATDDSINQTLNETLSDNNLDADFSNTDLAIEETDPSQINNLFNDNEL